MRQLVFYHFDHDGQCAGAIVKKKYSGCSLYQIDYSDEFPFWSIQKDDDIIMVDYSIEPFDRMIDLANMCNSLLWIDHHKSAISSCNKYKHYQDGDVCASTVCDNVLPPNMILVLDDSNGPSGCELTWRYFYPNKPIPYFVRLISWYDTWQHSESEDVLPFYYGISSYNTDVSQVECWIWDALFEDKNKTWNIIREGRSIEHFVKTDNKKYANDFAFEFEWEGLEWIAVNKRSNSKIFDGFYNPSKHDAMMCFVYVKGKWRVSLYSVKDGIDVGSIAVKYGGGGHTGAAGFHIDNINEVINGKI